MNIKQREVFWMRVCGLGWKSLGVAALVGVLLAAGLVGGCRRGGESRFWARAELSALPAEVRQLLDWSLSLEAGQVKTTEGQTYLLVTWGYRPQGAVVEIVDVARIAPGSADLQVTVRYTAASKDGPKTAQPYDVAVVKFAAGAVTWVVEDDPYGYVMQVLGEMRPIVAESRWIKIFAPSRGQTVGSPFVLSGLASVFEGTVNFRLVAEDGEVIIPVSYTMASMGDWGPFNESLDFSLPLGLALDPATGTVRANLEVFWFSPEDGDELDKIIIPLLLRP
jgi:hypothetical protein